MAVGRSKQAALQAARYQIMNTLEHLPLASLLLPLYRAGAAVHGPQAVGRPHERLNHAMSPVTVIIRGYEMNSPHNPW